MTDKQKIELAAESLMRILEWYEGKFGEQCSHPVAWMASETLKKLEASE